MQQADVFPRQVMRQRRGRWLGWLGLLATLLLTPGAVFGQAGGSVSGTVKDASGGVVPGATAVLANVALGTKFLAATDGQGTYSFPNVPVGRYDLTVSLAGFRDVRRAGIGVDINSRLTIDVMLDVGVQGEVVTVAASAVQVETSSTQIGAVVSANTMTALSLNGRSFTDLLAIQPGVIPTTTMQPDSIIMAGVTGAVAPSGQLNPGNLSISGQRESANAFLVNGSDVQERMNGGTSIVPNLDSVDQFRVLTSNFDPQYGNYNGGIVSVVTRSGSDRFGGSLFDFARNTALDSRNFFSPERAEFRQQQPGGTYGGPIRRGQAFFFGDYQATRTTQGIETGLVPVPTLGERSGDFSGTASTLTGTVNGPYWAGLLSQRLGYRVSPGEPYYTPGCVSTTQCVLPNALVPARAWSAPSRALLQYIPAPNTGTGAFSTAAFAQTVRDDKGSVRIDANTRLGLLSGYYFVDDYRLDNPYPTQQGGATVPGFDALTIGRSQLFALGSNKVFDATTVNEFHVSVMRSTNDIGRPKGGLGVPIASQGFVTGPDTPGIVVQAPQFEGVENVAFEKFAIGVTTTGVNQVNNTFHVSDNLSKVIRGGHTVRIGGEVQYAQVDIDPNAQFNGTFSFQGTETGSDFADFLLGIPSGYIQAAGTPFFIRNKYVGLFGQDSWRARKDLTINYGVRYDFMEPWYEKFNQFQTFIPGARSAVYPTGPEGFLYPGDAGIPRTLSDARHKFSPRVGVAYVPSFRNRALGWLFGRDGQSSIRASAGLFYTAIPGLSAGIMYSIPPYGENYLSPAPPLFETPFITAADGTNNGQPFPHTPAPLDASPAKPGNVDWSRLLPINGDPYYYSRNDVPYTRNYMVSVDRQLAARLVLSLSYVGSQGRHLLVVQPTNPGDPALCLSVSEERQVAPGSATCGPFSENGVFVRADGTVINGTRPFAPDFGSITAQKTIGHSLYNGFEADLRYEGPHGSFLLGYTLAKSMDTSSFIGEQINPFDPDATWAPSAFDLRHNVIASYTYDLPLDRLVRQRNAWTTGWAVSGITRMASGFPVTLYNDTDSSLLGTFGNGVNNHLLDTPAYTPGCDLKINHDPRRGDAFNTACFSIPELGQLGNAPRRFFYGPGTLNTDVTLVRRFTLGAHQQLQLRLEAFNVFDTAQFAGAGSVDGNVASATFGQIVRAAPPRLMQVAVKYVF